MCDKRQFIRTRSRLKHSRRRFPRFRALETSKQKKKKKKCAYSEAKLNGRTERKDQERFIKQGKDRARATYCRTWHVLCMKSSWTSFLSGPRRRRLFHPPRVLLLLRGGLLIRKTVPLPLFSLSSAHP